MTRKDVIGNPSKKEDLYLNSDEIRFYPPLGGQGVDSYYFFCNVLFFIKQCSNTNSLQEDNNHNKKALNIYNVKRSTPCPRQRGTKMSLVSVARNLTSRFQYITFRIRAKMSYISQM